MIRPLAQCPYCRDGELALTDNLQLIFNPDKNGSPPCPHLVWVDGRYSQWELSPLPGRKTRMARMIGSTEFEWLHPSLAAREDLAALRGFLKELATQGQNWAFAPKQEHTVLTISRDQNVTDEDGRVYPSWEIEGTAVYARDAAAFASSLSTGLDQQNATWEEPSDFNFT